MELHQAHQLDEPALKAHEPVPAARPSLGALLIEAGITTEEQLSQAMTEGAATGERLGEVILRLGLATEDDVARLLARQWGLPFASADLLTIPAESLGHRDELAQLGGVSVGLGDGQSGVAICDPHQGRLESIRAHLGHDAMFVVVTRSAFEALVQTWPGVQQDADPIVRSAEAEPDAAPTPELRLAAHPFAGQDEVEVERHIAGTPPGEREPAPEFDSNDTLHEIETLESTLEQTLAAVQVLRARWREMQQALEGTRSQLDESRALEATAAQHRQLADELKRLVRDYGSE